MHITGSPWTSAALCPFVLCAALHAAERDRIPSRYAKKILTTPDLTQTDPEGGFPNGGRALCGPVSVSNSFM